MNGDHLRILPYNRYGTLGIDVAVYSNKATVGDYCRAIEDYIIYGNYERKRSHISTCEGCDICCQERIPLTSIDVLRLREQQAAAVPGTAFKLEEIFKRFSYVTVSGRTVDISLSRKPNERCVFLDNESKKCLQYENRPFVCRTYLCASASRRLTKLRESIVNSGEDELVRLWILSAKDTEYVMHEVLEPAVNPADWPENVWTGKQHFKEIAIKDIVSPTLWTELFEAGEKYV